MAKAQNLSTQQMQAAMINGQRKAHEELKLEQAAIQSAEQKTIDTLNELAKLRKDFWNKFGN